jgi:dipeptidyl aminopeptidase/acylaminoacyl peptidase
MAAFLVSVAATSLGAGVNGLAQPPRGAKPQKGPGQTAAKEDPFAPMVKIQDEDYAKVRSHFRTKLIRKGPSPQPWSAAKTPACVNEIEYVSGELRLKAWVNRPADEDRKRPAVLFLHGGFAFGAPDDWDVSQPYRDAGFIVLTPMLRGENGQPGAFSFYYDEVDDVLAAAEYLRKQPYVDAERLYLAGPSAGGTLVLLAGMASKQFRAAVSFSAMPDQVLFCKHAKGARRDVPTYITELKELEVRSPLAYAASLKCPTRIFYGSKEPYLVATSQLTAKVAKEKGVDVEAVQVEGDHGTSVPPAIKQSIAFFRKN